MNLPKCRKFLGLAIGLAVLGASAPARAQESFERDIETVVFVPKGQWIAGLSVNYSQSSQNKYQFFILEGISGDTYSFRVSPMAMFAFKNDMAAGGRFNYSRSLTKLESADITLDAETGYNVDNLYRLAHEYSVSGLFRNYFSIGRSKRFGFFSEVQLTLGGGQAKLMQGKGESLTGTYERNFNFNVGVVPGICVFLNDYSAIEANVGVLGFNYTDRKGIRDQIYVSRITLARSILKSIFSPYLSEPLFIYDYEESSQTFIVRILCSMRRLHQSGFWG